MMRRSFQILSKLKKLTIVGAISFLGSTALFHQPAQAGICSPGIYDCTQSVDIDMWWQGQQFTSTQQNFLINNFYQDKVKNEFWMNNMLPNFKAMTSQWIAAKTHSTGAIGGFYDGQSLSEAQLTLQKLQAQAMRDYTPGENLCRIGTSVRSLAAANMNVDTTAAALNRIAENRLLGTRGGHSASGPDADREARFKQFQRLYCNPGDNNGRMKAVCYPTKTAAESNPERFNKDIDYTRTVDQRLTLDLGYANASLTQDEEDVLALSSNLYGHDVFNRLASAVLTKAPNQPNMPLYLDLRQIAALRSVAQNSFDRLAAQRARGAAGSAAFLKNVLREMGMSDAEAKRYLTGDTDEPSYYAQMEILTKKIYQNPNFYVSLIDKPANVKRQLAAMKAIELTQNRDLFESLQRQEVLMSLLLEIDVRQEIQRVRNNEQ